MPFHAAGRRYVTHQARGAAKCARYVLFPKWDAAIRFGNKAGPLFAPFGVLVAFPTNQADVNPIALMRPQQR